MIGRKRRRIRIRLDWKAYFVAFCQEHGEGPLFHRGRLLFRDGWTYSSTDYKGPEWPPPEDEEELLKLLLTYWTLRRSAVKKELVSEAIKLAQLKEATMVRSAPLQQSIPVTDGNGFRTGGMAAIRLELFDFEKRVEWLEEDVKLCQNEINDKAVKLKLLRAERRTQQQPQGALQCQPT